MPTELSLIESFLVKTFEGCEINDASWNGIQIENNGLVENIYIGVDATFDFIKAAPNPKNSLFLVHHGIYWKQSDPRTTGVLREKIHYCYRYNSALAAYHIPLDIHPIFGNNSQLLKKLGFNYQNLEQFGYKDGIYYGYSASSKQPINIYHLLDCSKKEFSEHALLFDFGKKNVQSCAVISGSGGFGIQEAY